MPRKKKVPLIVAVVQPVAKRLTRIEGLLIEMRYEQDQQIKKVNALREQFEQFLERGVRRKPRRSRKSP